ncbi:MAG TPA: ATP synthase F1 subunit gamma [candidate division Zixibacteria bacterium]|nr:ATP synthase F1 subunit gamma [candidate division Zixibacteria bacterium]
MANVLDIRRRIRSVKSTRQITKAMKMVSAAKLRRAQDRALAARPYAQMLTNVLKSLVKRADVIDPETGTARHPMLEQRPEQNLLLIVVTGDRGLAGAFNANILKVATRFIAAKQGKNIDIECIGRKGRDFFRRRYPAQDSVDDRTAPVRITGEHMGVLNKPDYAHLRPIVEDIIDRYTRQQIDAVYVLFNEFKSVIAQRLVVEQVMPITHVGERTLEEVEEFSAEERKRATEAAIDAGVGVRSPDTREIDEHARSIASEEVDYIYEQPAVELFRALLPRYIGIQLHRAILESVAAEHAARMTAMDSASNNATDMIDSLTLTMNRARQASITKEIIEIVSGAAAL